MNNLLINKFIETAYTCTGLGSVRCSWGSAQEPASLYRYTLAPHTSTLASGRARPSQCFQGHTTCRFPSLTGTSITSYSWYVGHGIPPSKFSSSCLTQSVLSFCIGLVETVSCAVKYTNTDAIIAIGVASWLPSLRLLWRRQGFAC